MPKKGCFQNVPDNVSMNASSLPEGFCNLVPDHVVASTFRMKLSLARTTRARRSSTDLRQMRSCCGSGLLTAFPTHLDQSGSVDFLGSWQRGFANEVQLHQLSGSVQSSICTDARWPEAARSPEPETGVIEEWLPKGDHVT